MLKFSLEQVTEAFRFLIYDKNSLLDLRLMETKHLMIVFSMGVFFNLITVVLLYFLARDNGSSNDPGNIYTYCVFLVFVIVFNVITINLLVGSRGSIQNGKAHLMNYYESLLSQEDGVFLLSKTNVINHSSSELLVSVYTGTDPEKIDYHKWKESVKIVSFIQAEIANIDMAMVEDILLCDEENGEFGGIEHDVKSIKHVLIKILDFPLDISAKVFDVKPTDDGLKLSGIPADFEVKRIRKKWSNFTWVWIAIALLAQLLLGGLVVKDLYRFYNKENERKLYLIKKDDYKQKLEVWHEQSDNDKTAASKPERPERPEAPKTSFDSVGVVVVVLLFMTMATQASAYTLGGKLSEEELDIINRYKALNESTKGVLQHTTGVFKVMRP